jgi:hypothetical protein
LSVKIGQIKTFAMLQEGFEDAKGVIRICQSKKTTQWPKDKGSRSNNTIFFTGTCNENTIPKNKINLPVGEIL